MSIFSKTCPECAAVNSAGATSCACGYSFEDDASTHSKTPLEVVAQEERLYLDYLTARVAQAAEAAKVAHRLANADPGNHTRAADALRADQLLMTARGELADQEARLHVANLKLERSKAFVRPAISPAAAKKPAAAKAVSPHISLTAPKKRSSHKAHAAPHKGATPIAPIASPPARADTSARANTATTVAKAPDKVPAQARKTRTEIPVPVPTATAGRTPTPAPTAKPGPVFRAAQAARAEKVMESREPVRKGAPVAAFVPPKSPVPAKPASRPAAQVATPAPKPDAAPTKECPHCWGSVPQKAARCRCGYEFSSGPELPGLTLSASERALFASLDFTGAVKPR